MREHKIQKVTIDYDDVTYIAEGKDAESWEERVQAGETLLATHGGGGWKRWTRVEKKGRGRDPSHGTDQSCVAVLRQRRQQEPAGAQG